MTENAADRLPVTRRSPSGCLPPSDGRSWQARLARSVRAELTAHLRGAPSATEAQLIETAVQIRIRLAAEDRKYAAEGTMSDHAVRTYLAWSNAYARLMTRLGLKEAAPKVRPAPLLRVLQARVHSPLRR